MTRITLANLAPGTRFTFSREGHPAPAAYEFVGTSDRAGQLLAVYRNLATGALVIDARCNARVRTLDARDAHPGRVATTPSPAKEHTMNTTPTVYYPRTGPDAFTLTPPAPVTVCPVCEYRTMLGYPLCDAHNVDVWAGAR